MNLLQNVADTLYFSLEKLKSKYPALVVQHGFPTNAPAGLVIALEHDKTKVDMQHELAGYRRRPRVFFADIYSETQQERNGLCEEIKDLFENKHIPLLDSQRNETGDLLIGEGVRIEVDLTQTTTFKARAKIYVSTLIQ